MFICSHCGEVSAYTFKRAGNAKAWAVGRVNTNNLFTVRRIVWGLLAAQYEKRIDEEIRGAIIMIEVEHKQRQNPIPKELRE